LKLLNPLGVALKLAQTYGAAAENRLQTLSDDIKAIDNIEGQLQAYHDDMLNDFTPRLAQLEGLLQELEARGNEFFDEHIRVGRARHLIKRDYLSRLFREEVVGDMDRQIDNATQSIIDWLIERNLKLWQDINAYLDRRQVS